MSNGYEFGIFGPSDCDAEKSHLKRLISDDGTLEIIADKLNFALKYISGNEVTSGPGRAQERINRYIQQHEPDLSIFIFRDRLGIDAGLGITGTEKQEEWREALETLTKRTGFDLGLYFAETS